MSDQMMRIENVTYAYTESLTVFKDVTFDIYPGERIAIVGVSGVGKSTLLHVLGLLDAPSKGKIFLNVEGRFYEAQSLSDVKRTALRCHMIGTVYQFHHLLPEFTAEENVMMPQLIAGFSKQHARKRAIHLLMQVGLKDRLHHYPTQLSGGQQQRVAIARALANNPKIVLADEPTGNLDEATADQIFQLFLTMSKEQNVSVIMTTHNMRLAQHMDRVFTLRHGSLVENTKNLFSQ